MLTAAAIIATAKDEFPGWLSMRLYTTRNAHPADANGKPRLIKTGLRSVETLLQSWHLYSTVIIGCSLKKIVRDVAANVAVTARAAEPRQA
jgi:hypothetical protein